MIEDQQIETKGLLRQIEDPELIRLSATEGEDGDGLNIEGYWAVVDSETLIDSWEGTFTEKAASGAFRRTLRARTPIMQFDHGYHPLLGSLPLGRWNEALEDDHGAFSRGRLSDNWLVEPFRDAIADGGVKGMSYRFEVVRDIWHDAAGNRVKPEDVRRLIYASNIDEADLLTRTLLEVRVAEAGPVVWPAYEQTSVGVRSKLVIDLGRLRDRDTRAELARAVYMADAAERSDSTSESSGTPHVTDETSSPGEHVPDTDTPRTTDEASSPGEHESAPSATDARALLRAEIQRARAAGSHL